MPNTAVAGRCPVVPEGSLSAPVFALKLTTFEADAKDMLLDVAVTSFLSVIVVPAVMFPPIVAPPDTFKLP
jgi:uncharacterized RDD family membrane protein YckC